MRVEGCIRANSSEVWAGRRSEEGSGLIMFRVSCFGSWVSGSGFQVWVSGVGFRCQGSGCSTSFGFRVSGIDFRVRGSEFGFRFIWVSSLGFRFRVSASDFRVQPPWRQPRGNWMVSWVNSHTNAIRIEWHLWEIDLRFAPGLSPGWGSGCSTSAGSKLRSETSPENLLETHSASRLRATGVPYFWEGYHESRRC